MTSFDVLLPLVKRKLRIAVDDAEDDARIGDMMVVAGQELSDMLGLPPWPKEDADDAQADERGN